MDTNHNRDEGKEDAAGVKEYDGVQVVSFLKEKRSFSIERIREFMFSREGKRAGIIAGVALLAIFLLAVVAGMSLPGQALYGIKTGVFEPSGELVRWTTESRARYQLGLMEARLDETKKLIKREAIGEDIQNKLVEQVSKNSQRFTDLAGASEERTLDRIVVMDMANNFASVMKAMEDASESNESMIVATDAIAEIRRDAIRRLRDEIEVYVSLTDDEALHELLTQELNTISAEIGRGEASEDTQARVGRLIENIAKAIVANDATDALEAAYEARRLMKVENYLK